MKGLLVMAWLVGLGVVAGPDPRPNTHAAYVHLDGEWASPPPGIKSRVKTAPAHVFVFHEDGTFAEHWCWLVKQGNGAVLISNGDPHIAVVGRWQSRQDTIALQRVKVFRTVRLLDASRDPLCDEVQVSVTSKGPKLVVGGEDFGINHAVPLDGLHPWEREAIESAVRCGA